jgi:GT2 family glycosyltransferase
MTHPTLIVVILAWNHRKETQECIDSFLATNYTGLKILLVDNGSTDGTFEYFSKNYDQIEIVKSETNLGIAAGYNLGIKKALEINPKYLLIANNDIIVHTEMLKNLVTGMDKIPKAGMGMPRIMHYYGDKPRIWCIGGRWRFFPPSVKMIGYNSFDVDRFMQPMELDFAPSCCLLIRSSIFEKVGFFDSGYFFYYDDWDFSIRLRNAGYKIIYLPSSIVMHKVSVSTQKSDKPSIWWQYYGRSTARFYSKHSSILVLFVISIWIVLRELVKLKPTRIKPFLQGLIIELRASPNYRLSEE